MKGQSIRVDTESKAKNNGETQKVGTMIQTLKYSSHQSFVGVLKGKKTPIIIVVNQDEQGHYIGVGCWYHTDQYVSVCSRPQLDEQTATLFVLDMAKRQGVKLPK